MGNLRVAENQGLKKIASIPDDNTYGNSTYLQIAKDAHNNNIIKPQIQVYEGLEKKAKADYKKNLANVVVIEHRKVDPTTGEITYGGLSVEDYRKKLLNTLKPNSFYAEPFYKPNGEIDTQKEPIFYMHRAVLSKTSDTNPLGLKTFKIPKMID